MASVLATSSGFVAPPLRLNHRLQFEFVDTEATWAAADVDIYFDKVGADPLDRVTVVGTDPEATVGGTSILFDGDSAWVAANLSEGDWECHVLADEVEEVWFRFQVLTPPAGAFTP